MMRNDRGATAVEYSLIVVFVAAVIAGAVLLLGQHVISAFSSMVGRF
jgi:Flp pilus assembly pilin Flp